MSKDTKTMDKTEARTGKIIEIHENEVKQHLSDIVRGTVEETLNALLDAEADQLCNAERYERNARRKDTRAGHYKRKLHTTAGEVELKVPKLRTLPFETTIIQRYKRRESSVEEALIEMYLAGVSVRRDNFGDTILIFLPLCFLMLPWAFGPSFLGLQDSVQVFFQLFNECQVAKGTTGTFMTLKGLDFSST